MGEFLVNFINTFSNYESVILFIPFIILIFCGLGLPLPEDILLITLGYLVFNGYGSIYTALVLGYLGIMLGDSIIFFVGRKYGLQIVKNRFFSKVFTKERLRRAKRFTLDHGKKTLFLARFLPGLRTAVFFSCATLKVRFRTFFIIDSLAALLSAPIFVLLGYYFGDKIETLIDYVKRVDRVVIIILLFIIAFVIVTKRLYNRKKSDSSASQDGDQKIDT
ncbi:MAG: DedA family protein [Proteobacteria bacterium]|nr:DedA family protein [Pseudomonadota bacterium]